RRESQQSAPPSYRSCPMTTKKRRRRKPRSTVLVTFHCFECNQGYHTRLPEAIADVAQAAWARVHMTDTGCQSKVATLPPSLPPSLPPVTLKPTTLPPTAPALPVPVPVP